MRSRKPTIVRTVLAACCDTYVGLDSLGKRWELRSTKNGSYKPTGKSHQCDDAARA